MGAFLQDQGLERASARFGLKDAGHNPSWTDYSPFAMFNPWTI